MAQTVNVIIRSEDSERLLAIANDRSHRLKHIQCARIFLSSAERLPVPEVARRARVSRPAVSRWRQRYGEKGVEGVLRDKTRKPGRAPLSAEVVAEVLALTCSQPPDEAMPRYGQGRRHFAARRPALVRHASSPAASPAHLQTLQRSRIALARSRRLH
jgi:hypothetical protein